MPELLSAVPDGELEAETNPREVSEAVVAPTSDFEVLIERERARLAELTDEQADQLLMQKIEAHQRVRSDIDTAIDEIAQASEKAFQFVQSSKGDATITPRKREYGAGLLAKLDALGAKMSTLNVDSERLHIELGADFVATGRAKASDEITLQDIRDNFYEEHETGKRSALDAVLIEKQLDETERAAQHQDVLASLNLDLSYVAKILAKKAVAPSSHLRKGMLSNVNAYKVMLRKTLDK